MNESQVAFGGGEQAKQESKCRHPARRSALWASVGYSRPLFESLPTATLLLMGHPRLWALFDMLA